MTLESGQRLPDADLLTMGENGPEPVSLAEKLAGKTVVLFAVPGAFTGTCSTAHMPSFTRTADAFREKGVDDILCVSVNDPYTMAAWGAQTGAGDAGITLVCDASGAFTQEIGMAFSAPPVGLYNRSTRYALIAKDGVVEHVGVDKPGICELSAGEALLDKV